MKITSMQDPVTCYEVGVENILILLRGVLKEFRQNFFLFKVRKCGNADVAKVMYRIVILSALENKIEILT